MLLVSDTVEIYFFLDDRMTRMTCDLNDLNDPNDLNDLNDLNDWMTGSFTDD